LTSKKTLKIFILS